MGNRRFGFMLSGGLDSSLIASIASKFLTHKPIAFSVGFEDSPDLENARLVAKFLNIPHKVLVITPEDCIKIIPGKAFFSTKDFLQNCPTTLGYKSQNPHVHIFSPILAAKVDKTPNAVP
jgi:asparagine synthetase B (glutamine-hydrolysing)